MEMMMRELGEIITGNTPSKTIEKFWDSEDIYFIKPDIITDGEVNEICESNEYISEGARKKARVVSKNAIFVTCIGSIGKIGIATDGEYAFNQQINAIVPNEKVCPKYLAYNLLFNRPRLIAVANAPVVPIINKSQFGDFTVNIDRDINRQFKIVERLDKITYLIKQRTQELNFLDNLVKARFVEIFGDPICNPKGWPVRKLKDISVLITNGNTPHGGSENYISSGIVFLRSQNIWRNKIIYDDVVYIDKRTHCNMSKSSLRHGDILITKTGRFNTENSSLGRAALFLGDDNTANINGHIYLIRLNNTVLPEYVTTILTGESYRQYIRRVCVGGIDKRQINLEQVEEFPIICPSIEMQQNFVAFKAQVDKSRLVIEKSLKELETLQASLMQKYFG